MRHQGGCHCGKVRYSVETELKPLIRCNCSHCQAKGFVLTFVEPADFELLQGEDALTAYRFNTHNIEHLFCSSCGVESFARGKTPDGASKVAINVHCLDGVDRFELDPTNYPGRNA